MALASYAAEADGTQQRIVNGSWVRIGHGSSSYGLERGLMTKRNSTIYMTAQLSQASIHPLILSADLFIRFWPPIPPNSYHLCPLSPVPLILHSFDFCVPEHYVIQSLIVQTTPWALCILHLPYFLAPPSTHTLPCPQSAVIGHHLMSPFHYSTNYCHFLAPLPGCLQVLSFPLPGPLSDPPPRNPFPIVFHELYLRIIRMETLVSIKRYYTDSYW